MKKIEILGTGCAKCQRLEKNAKKAVDELGMDAEIEEVQELEEISARGVMSTPGIAIDGEVQATGEVLNPEQIKEMLQE
ncbi:MAG: thioredoxin family protein [Candidatus Thermoplasmatota archaeon]